MKVVIEGKQVDFDVSDKQVTLKGAVTEVESFLYSVGKVPVGLKINGKSLTQESLQAKEQDVLQKNDELEFDVVEITAHLADQLAGCYQSNQNLMQLIDKVTAEDARDTGSWQQLIANLESFFQYWHRMKMLLPQQMSQVSCGGQPLNGQVERMLGFCKEVTEAMAQKDAVLAIDLLRHEIVPAIDSIDQAIPRLQDVLREIASCD